MNFRQLMLIAGATCAAAVPVAAQEPMARGDTFDLVRAIMVAHASNPRIAAASAEVVAAGARIGPAGALPDPRLTFGLMNRMMPGFATGDPVTMNQVTLTQMVPVNGALGRLRQASRFDSTRVAWDRKAVGLEVERDVRSRYWDLYHADRALEVMDRTIGVLRDLVTISSTMYGVGRAAQSDVLRAQLAVTRMQQEQTDMRLMRYSAAAALNALLARPADAPVVLPRDPHDEHAALMTAVMLPELPSLDSLGLLADSANPELAGARAAMGAAEANESAARRMLYPDLELGAAYGRRPPSDNMVSVMVGVSLPVFARSRQLRMRDEAGAMREAARQELRRRQLDVRAMLSTALAEGRTARAQVESYRAGLLPQAAAAYDAALAAYRVGQADFPTVLDAQMALLQYQHDLHRYEATFGTAIAELDRLVGRSYGTTPWDR